MPDEDLLALYAGCRAVLYAPLDEDYGYVPVEAFLSQRPVITTGDAGGPLEFVEDGVDGLVRPPEPEAPWPRRSTRVFARPPRALREMGEVGRARGASHHLGRRDRRARRSSLA